MNWKEFNYFDAIIITLCHSNQTEYILNNSVTSKHYSREIQAIMRNYQTFSIYFALYIACLLPQDVHAWDYHPEFSVSFRFAQNKLPCLISPNINLAKANIASGVIGQRYYLSYGWH